jgi:hypothetical protein
MTALAASKGMGNLARRLWENVIAAWRSDNNLKKDGAKHEPKTWPTGIMRNAPKTYAKAMAKSG